MVVHQALKQFCSALFVPVQIGRVLRRVGVGELSGMVGHVAVRLRPEEFGRVAEVLARGDRLLHGDLVLEKVLGRDLGQVSDPAARKW